MIYLDNNATTHLAPEVQKTICNLFPEYGNPSAIHQAGIKAKEVIAKSKPPMTKQQYLQSLDGLFNEEDYQG